MDAMQSTAEKSWLPGRLAIPLRTYSLLFVFLSAWSLDFRANTREQLGGSLIQFVFLFFCFGSGTIFCLLDKTQPPSKSLLTITLGWIAGISLQLICAVAYPAVGLQDTLWPIFLRQSIPYLNITLSLCVIQSAVRQNISLRVIMRLLAILLPISCIFRAFYAIAIAGYDIETIRYQVQSGGLMFCVAYGLATIFFEDKIDLLGYFNLGTFIVITALSVTRTLIVIFAACLVASIILMVIVQFKGMKINGFAKFKQFSFILLLAMITAIIIIAVRPNTFKKWTDRTDSSQNKIYTNEGAIDMSVEGRAAQVRGEVKKFTSNPVYVLFGATFGGFFIPDSRYYVEMNMREAYNRPMYGGADSGIVYTLFGGGLLFGGFILTIFAWCVYASMATVVRSGSIRQPHVTPFVATLALFFVASMTYSFTGSILEDRYGAQVFGICTALLLVMWDRSRARSVNVTGGPALANSELFGY